MKTSKLLHQRKGSLLLELAIVAIITMILLSPFLPSSGTTIRTASDNVMIDQTLVIDNALNIWSSSHSGVYPNNLTVLQDMNFISMAIDLTQFSYSLQNSQTEYRLTTNLKNGTTYKSAGSKY